MRPRLKSHLDPASPFPVSHFKVLPELLGRELQHVLGSWCSWTPQTVGVIVRLERETFQVCVCCTQWWGLPSFLSLELLILGRWQIVVAKIHTALSGRSDSVSRGWLCGVGQVACHYPLCTCFIPCKMEISVSCISLKP